MLLAAALFRLWDGRVLEVEQWITHGDEYVVTLGDGNTLIVPQREVREIVPAGHTAQPTPPARPSPPPRKPPPPR
jgi:hypothetical protein